MEKKKGGKNPQDERLGCGNKGNGRARLSEAKGGSRAGGTAQPQPGPGLGCSALLEHCTQLQRN